MDNQHSLGSARSFGPVMGSAGVACETKAEAPTCAISELERMGKLVIEGERQLNELHTLIGMVDSIVHGPKPQKDVGGQAPADSMPLGMVELRHRLDRHHMQRDSELQRLGNLLGVHR